MKKFFGLLFCLLFLGFSPHPLVAGTPHPSCKIEIRFIIRRPKPSFPVAVLKGLSSYLAPKNLLLAALPFPAPERFKKWANPNAIPFKSPWVQSTQKWISRVYKAGAWTSLAGVALLATEISSGSFLSVEEFLDKKAHPLADDEIQLILTPTLIPHIAIRIGDEVFNFGQDGFSVQSLEAHILERPLLRQSQAHEKIWNKDPELLFSDSKQFITLKLDKDRVKKLRIELKNFSYQSWANWPLIHDCVTISSHFLSKVGVEIPFFIDSSPTQVFAQLATLKVFQDRLLLSHANYKVVHIGQVFVENQTHQGWQTAQNLLFNSWESKFVFWSWVYSKGLGRAAFELTHKDLDSKIYWNPEILQTLNENILVLSNKKLENELGEFWIDFLMAETQETAITDSNLLNRLGQIEKLHKEILGNPEKDFVDQQMAKFIVTRIQKLKKS